MPAKLESMCRTCMHDGNVKGALLSSKINGKREMIPIEQMAIIESVNIPIIEILRESVPQLKLDQNDKLPRIICSECSNKLKELHLFQRKCLKVEIQFNEMLEEATDKSGDEKSLSDIFEKEPEDGALKAELEDDVFVDENSFQSDQFIDEEIASDDDIVDVEDDDFIESCCSDLSIDFVLDAESDLEDSQTGYMKPSIPNKTNHEKGKSNRHEEEIYPCNRCKRKLKSKISLKKHIEMHDKKIDEEPKCVCHICKRAFSQAYMLRDHLRTHSGEKPFLCSECGKGFTTSSSLKQHSFRHQSEKLFSCPDCPKTFPTRTDLASHYDIHKARPKSHICDVCGRGFPKPFLLKKHKMYHTNERRFSCEFCEKRFYTNEKLQRHTRIHTGEKPYKCKYCEKAYCQSNELTKHLRCHLGENVYQCQLCPQRFATVKLVKEHFSAHKNDDEETRAQNLAAFQAVEIKGIFCR